jgi:hypothetical protein
MDYLLLKLKNGRGRHYHMGVASGCGHPLSHTFRPRNWNGPPGPHNNSSMTSCPYRKKQPYNRVVKNLDIALVTTL